MEKNIIITFKKTHVNHHPVLPCFFVADDEVNKSDSSIPEEEEADPLDTGNPWPGMLRRCSADRRPSQEILDYDETTLDPAGRRSRNQAPNQPKIAGYYLTSRF